MRGSRFGTTALAHENVLDLANNRIMDPRILPYMQTAAEKQQAFQEALGRLMEFGQRLLRNPSSEWTDAVSREQTHLFEEYCTARDEMDEAISVMYEKALAAAGVPGGHPLWDWSRARRGEH